MRGLGLTWLAAWREMLANPRGLATQVGAMVLNNLVWVLFWVLFFDEVGTVRGWDTEQIVVLLAVVTTSVGAVLGLFNNVLRIGEEAASGGLDAALALPVMTLPYLLSRRVDATHVGDLAFGPVLFLVAGHPTPSRLAVLVFGVACSAVLIAGFLVMMGSVSFFAGRNEAGEMGFHSLILFAMYPIDVFPGVARFLLYVVVPAGFVSSAPARLVDDPSPAWALACLVVAAAFGGAGWLTFSAGLRRYTSGSHWSDA
jgi:ABC-2 type transport system permease protein